MSDQNLDQASNIYSDEGKVLVSVTSIKREGDQLKMVGKLMGSWEAVMFVPSDMTVKMIKLMLNWSVISYVLSLPIIRLRKKRKPT